MTSGTSFKAMQWLTYMETTSDLLVNRNGDRVKMEHAYYRGEKNFHGWLIDGYAEVDDRHIFFEYLGDYYHAGCSKCNPDRAKDWTWEKKRQHLDTYGKLVFIRECEFDKYLPLLKDFDTPIFPKIMNRGGNEQIILDGIKKDELFGFIVADATTPPDVLEKIKDLNFPPIIQRMDITKDHLSTYMNDRAEAMNTKFPKTTVVQTYHGQQLLLFTPLVQFYLKLGLEITNITSFIQYLPYKCLAPFMNKVTEMRIQAAYDDEETKGNSAKLIGNSGYVSVLCIS